jgi:hypothetical protein
MNDFIDLDGHHNDHFNLGHGHSDLGHHDNVYDLDHSNFDDHHAFHNDHGFDDQIDEHNLSGEEESYHYTDSKPGMNIALFL